MDLIPDPNRLQFSRRLANRAPVATLEWHHRLPAIRAFEARNFRDCCQWVGIARRRRPFDLLSHEATTAVTRAKLLTLKGHTDAEDFVSINPAARAVKTHHVTHLRLVMGHCEEMSMLSEQALARATARALWENFRIEIVKHSVFRSL